MVYWKWVNWGLIFVQDQAYIPPLPKSIPELKWKITTALDLIGMNLLTNIWQRLIYPWDIFRVTMSSNIEYLYETLTLSVSLSYNQVDSFSAVSLRIINHSFCPTNLYPLCKIYLTIKKLTSAVFCKIIFLKADNSIQNIYVQHNPYYMSFVGRTITLWLWNCAHVVRTSLFGWYSFPSLLSTKTNLWFYCGILDCYQINWF